MFNTILRPGIKLGYYPQKKEDRLTEFEHSARLLVDRIKHQSTRQRLTQQYIINLIAPYEAVLKSYSEQQLTLAIEGLSQKLHCSGLSENLIAQAFATIREAATRTLGQRHFDVQMFGGWLLINGVLAEMATGEGKTLTATLATCTAAMAGIPVHVITANDYLADRDEKFLQPLYQRLNLTAGSITEGMTMADRRPVYQCQIVHITGKQIVFDFLRDTIELGGEDGALTVQFRQIKESVIPGKQAPLLLRGLCFAIVDEADSVLIDEAKTPLIITQQHPNAEKPETYNEALFLASSLLANEDFLLDQRNRKVELTRRGEHKLTKLSTHAANSVWQNKRKRDFLVTQALTADYLFLKDEHYVLVDDKVQIVDELTGRLMPDRTWEQGLHQLIEAKEGCVISELREPLARISYQRFFNRYLHLVGLSGTLVEVSGEMQQVYGRQTIQVATNRPSRRLMMKEHVYRTTSQQRQAFLQRVNECHKIKQPVLIGTSSVAASETTSQWLRDIGLPHHVLNAKQNQQEARIIAQAGQPEAITVATNMAGRGTDIILGEGVAELGGLHVITLNLNDIRRLDRQLYGRCARQGEPGSAEAILSLEDPALQHFYSSAILKFSAKFCQDDRPMPTLISNLLIRYAQAHNEKRQRKQRLTLTKQDRQLRRILAFAGKFE